MPEDQGTQLKPLMWLPWAIIGGVVVALAVIAVLKFAAKPASPLPSSATKENKFALYYPSPVPSGYKYQAGSYKVSNHVVIFLLQNAALKVYVAEQALPQPAPNFANRPNIKPVDSLTGKIYTGTDSGRPVAIVQTNTTLITISGAKDVPLDVVTSLAQSLRSLPR
jgi:hypothetical protein